ncbi:MAG TPA: carnitine dehydratase [Microbacterium sp.]|nr:carnitine dehydratase [Microbacterium sp.]
MTDPVESGGRYPVPEPSAPLASRLSVGALAHRSVSSASRAAARLTSAKPQLLDLSRIAVAYTSERYIRFNGESSSPWAALSGFFRTSDGWVRTHGNYPHHAEALRAGLGLRPDAGRDAVERTLAAMPAGAATHAVTARGGICIAVMPENPVADELLAADPPVRVEHLGSSPARPRTWGAAAAPLRGIRVLDLTRVIAGPVATRTLALLGADVLRIDPPHRPELPAQHADTGHGKRSAVLDLRRPADRAVFDRLLIDADVVVLGYRPSGLQRLGLSPAALSARHPGLILARLSAWGFDPSVADRRGFDSIVQAASGIAWIESREDAVPGALPAQALDHSAGYLLAAEILTLLQRQAAEGGSWLAETSLRRIAAELLRMPRTIRPSIAEPFDPAPHLQSFAFEGGTLTTAAPAVAYEGGPDAFAPPRPWGSDAPAWL